ncbi:hypothetical protein AX15_005953 [Amanita polypyramis BW_CC]|nr:hypothetical protein AX15_005953 [Amanita polypyramis BW_CC]
MGGIADRLLYRKRILLFFACLGSVSATLFLLLPSSSPVWYLSTLLAACANVGFGASTVAMNAYLPSLASDSPEVAELLRRLHDEGHHINGQVHRDTDLHEDSEDPNAPLIPHQSTPNVPISDAYTQNPAILSSSDTKSEYDATLSRATSRISSQGIALGYGAGIILLIIALIPVVYLHGSTFALRLAIGLSGIWWMIFTIPATVWLPGKVWPSQGVPSSGLENADSAWGGIPASGATRTEEWSLWREVVEAWKKLGGMLWWSETKKLRNTFTYLAAWFLLSDGIAQYIFQPIPLLIVQFYRLHDDNIDCCLIWQNSSAHATILPYSCWRLHSCVGYSRLPFVAKFAETIRLVKSSRPSYTCFDGLCCTSIWVSRIFDARYRGAIRGTNDSRGDVWLGSVFRVGIWRLSRIRKGIVRGTSASRRRSPLVCAVRNNRQVKLIPRTPYCRPHI